mmetsp:Transcript_30507/g.35040  ORF Transcript_30507/g.35040 Transcript_30507/m.35040 type:complete len:334 (+) Transcript_30507:111-1112(+)
MSSSLPAFDALPIEWTKINRLKKRRKNPSSSSAAKGVITNEEEDNSEYAYCCVDPTTCDVKSRNGIKNQSSDKNKSSDRTEGVVSNKYNKNNERDNNMATLSGKGIFCIHSLDCEWFQGHFIPSRMNNSSFGLLAVQRHDMDECMKCKDGGYREIDLTILAASKKTTRREKAKDYLNKDKGNGRSSRKEGKSHKRRELKIEGLQCTGGDMLVIRTPLNNDEDDIDDNNIRQKQQSQIKETNNDTNTKILFEAEKLITGIKVEPLVRRYFSSLLPPDSPNNKESVLDLLPDCAIVVGNMEVRIPTSFVYSDNMINGVDSNHELNVTEAIDDWLE